MKKLLCVVLLMACSHQAPQVKMLADMAKSVAILQPSCLISKDIEAVLVPLAKYVWSNEGPIQTTIDHEHIELKIVDTLLSCGPDLLDGLKFCPSDVVRIAELTRIIDVKAQIRRSIKLVLQRASGTTTYTRRNKIVDGNVVYDNCYDKTEVPNNH